MKVTYQDGHVEALCKQSKLAVMGLGKESARKLSRRMSELFAATVVAELVIGRPHPLAGDRAGQFAVDLHRAKRLIFKPTGVPPLKADGSIDWSSVTDITIIEAVDYHD